MPVKHPSALLGYNNNVRHKGKVFHVQTEDSGVKYGHIITHLFMDGGRILKSVKTSYSEYLDNDRMGEIVREMMKQQHKAMFIALRDGKFDAIIESSDTGHSSTQSFPAAVPVAPSSTSALSSPGPAPARAATASPGSTGSPGTAVASPAPPSVGAPLASKPAAPTPSPAATAARHASPTAPAVERAPPSVPRASDELSLDIDAVERAAAAISPSSTTVRGTADLPPPPANLFREKAAAGKYRISSPPAARPTGPVPAAGRPPSSSPMPAAARAPGAAGERRYAPTRPASIFGQARPQQGKSIFGEDLISDKSLDEVILSYLAEDLEGEKK
jgi:hypothetical protein